jgi:dihydrofolate synthase / folylpolyglutamate synthase
MDFTSFDQIINYMEHFTNLERKTNLYSVRTYRLDRMQAIMQVLGNPQNSYKTIHVAGSKGKGSTASFIACGLKAAGFKVGLYLSPHVSDYRERFTLCGQFVDDQTLICTGNKLYHLLEGFKFCPEYGANLGENEPTTFELYTAFAFLLFKELGCNWAVIETGLGGRLDATNILHPQASVLTPIELEHTEILGDTLTKIAIEKSKIIKPGVPAFTSFQEPDVLDVFRKEAQACGSELFELGKEFKYTESACSNDIQTAEIAFKDGFKTRLELKMVGYVQAENCALALLVLRELRLYVKGKTEKAFNENRLPGRLEKVDWKRPLYLDGAHTENSMKNLLETFRALYPQPRKSYDEDIKAKGVCIFGSVKGKNHSAMCDEILASFDKIIVCRPGTFKKSDPEALYKMLLDKVSANKDWKDKQIYLRVQAKEALELAVELTTEKEPILACGSFYLAGVIKEAIEE